MHGRNSKIKNISCAMIEIRDAWERIMIFFSLLALPLGTVPGLYMLSQMGQPKAIPPNARACNGIHQAVESRLKGRLDVLKANRTRAPRCFIGILLEYADVQSRRCGTLGFPACTFININDKIATYFLLLKSLQSCHRICQGSGCCGFYGVRYKERDG